MSHFANHLGCLFIIFLFACTDSKSERLLSPIQDGALRSVSDANTTDTQAFANDASMLEDSRLSPADAEPDSATSSVRDASMSLDATLNDTDVLVDAFSQTDANLDATEPLDTMLNGAEAQVDAEFAPAVEYETYQFTEDLTDFPNPERGLYLHSKWQMTEGGASNLSREQLQAARANGMTLVFRLYDLREFLISPLSISVLETLEADFQTFRSLGMKIILRFRYSSSSTAPYGDAPPDQVYSHLNQLAPILQRNEDVIFAVQAGFIGAWGEWYYTDHWGDRGTWLDADRANRLSLVNALLDAVPATRSVQLRTPHYRTALFGVAHHCHDGSRLSRIGHHNDCFLANRTDYGTYRDASREYPWLSQDTRCTPMGGETCNVDTETNRTSCATALDEMARFHWTYLNAGYRQEVLDIWRQEGCMPEVKRRLGYRLLLRTATLPARASAGSTVSINLTVENVGFAAPSNIRRPRLILKARDRDETWAVSTQHDIRHWLPEDDLITLSFDVRLPDELTIGTYDWFMALPDASASLAGDPRYAIRLANQDVWHDDSGWNSLAVVLTVESGAANDASDGAMELEVQ